MQTLPIKPFDMSRFAYFVEGKLEFKSGKLVFFIIKSNIAVPLAPNLITLLIGQNLGLGVP